MNPEVRKNLLKCTSILLPVYLKGGNIGTLNNREFKMQQLTFEAMIKIIIYHFVFFINNSIIIYS